jgi:arylsulfatase A-like enzyme
MPGFQNWGLSIATAVLIALIVRCTGTEEVRSPNIIIIFTDDQGYSDVGSFGARGLQTPNLDGMAREGIRLTSFYVSSPVCSASRAALLTGCYHRRVGIHGALNPQATIGLNPKETTVAELAREKGYATAMVGKWHLGHHPVFLPVNHGFDQYFGLPYSNDMSPDPKNNPRERARRWPPIPLIRDLQAIEYEPDQSQLTKRYTETAVAFIEANKEKPFLLYLAHTMPHVPLYASTGFQGKSARGLYGDVIEEIDWSVGEIMSTIKKHQLDESTLIIFTSDNGPWKVFGNHGGTCEPLRGSKGTTWEGGIRVPLIARWPGRIPAAEVCDEPAMTIDILPTIAGLLGADLPEHKIDGEDIWPLLTDQSNARSPHEALFFYYHRELQAMRAGKWKLLFPHEYRHVQQPGADGMPGSYVYPSTGLALYDLDADLGESQNLAGTHPEVIERLSLLADQIRIELGDGLAKQAGMGIRPAGSLAKPE